jgi:hypothetical protein
MVSIINEKGLLVQTRQLQTSHEFTMHKLNQNQHAKIHNVEKNTSKTVFTRKRYSTQQ